MIGLRTLGHTELNTDYGGDADALVAQPKRFALLCYLAIPKPSTMQRRDTLLGVFWPEGDTEHSRTALRQALAQIRRVLGDDVIVRRGAEEVAVNPDMLWCDVGAFEQALDECRWADAIELYGGELLTGFHLANAPEFERWLDGERARLAGRYAKALEELANAAAAAGNVRAEVEWWQSLVRHDPYDSRYAMGLMEALERAGDPANALLHARKHKDLLWEELKIGPGTEFETLEEELGYKHAQSDWPEVGVAPEERSTTSQSLRSERAPVRDVDRVTMEQPVPMNRWVGVRSKLAAAAVVAGAVFAGFTLRHFAFATDETNQPPLERPFSVLATVGGNADSLVRDAVEFVLRTGIDMSHVVQTLPLSEVTRLLSLMGRPTNVQLDAEAASEMALRGGVGTIVVPRLDRFGTTYALTIRVEDASTRELKAEGSGRALGADAIVEIVDSAVQTLLGDLGESTEVIARREPLPQVLTPSLDALLKFREGAELVSDATINPRAVLLLKEALELDTMFATAWRSLAAAYSNLGHLDSVLYATRNALRFPDRLLEDTRWEMEVR